VRDLPLRMELNLAGHASHLHRRTPGMTVRQEPDLLVADSGIDDGTFNIVAAARLRPGEAAARIRQTAAELAAAGRRFTWWVGPASAPGDLAARLTAAGWPPVETDTAMWAPIDALPEPEPVPGLDIRPVASPGELAGFAGVLAADSDPPAPAVRRFYELTAAAAMAAGSPARYLVGYHRGEPACTAELFCQDGLAGVYCVATLAGCRRRGYATAITLAALQAAREAGLGIAVLQASGLGERVYRRLGFRACGTYTQHVMPGAPAAPPATAAVF
jgi:GNAT superfamily N-acetyltransferase